MAANEYFETIVGRLSLEEAIILGILFDQDHTESFKAIKRNELYSLSELSVANFRKTMDKLTATQLIGVVTGGKDHKVFLTPYGIKAVHKSVYK